MLEQHSGSWAICGEVDDGQDAIDEVTKLLPDVLLLDASIPLIHRLAVSPTVKEKHPGITIVLMSEQNTSVLALMAEAAGTAHYIAKSRIGIDLIPMLKSLSKDFGTATGAPS